MAGTSKAFQQLLLHAQASRATEDVAAAVEYGADLLREMDKSPQAAAVAANLGVLLWQQFRASGDPELVDASVRYARRALATARAQAPEWVPRFASNLGSSLHSRYDSLGTIDDLREAVDLTEEAVAGTAAGDPARPVRLRNLAGALAERFRSDGEFDDIDRAVDLFVEAVAGTPPDAERLPGLLTDLARACLQRSAARDDPGQRRADLGQAIKAAERALSGPGGAAADAVDQLATAAAELSRLTGSAAEPALSLAIRLLDEHEAGRPPAVPLTVARRIRLARLLLHRRDSTGAVADLVRAEAELTSVADDPAADTDELAECSALLIRLPVWHLDRRLDAAGYGEALAAAERALVTAGRARAPRSPAC